MALRVVFAGTPEFAVPCLRAAARSAEVVAVYMYVEAFSKSRWGSAAAIGVLLLILTMLLSVVIMRVTRRETYEY